MNFFIEWFVFSFAILCSLGIDNILWMFWGDPRAKSEYDALPNIKSKLWYITKERFIQVLKHPIDITAVIPAGFILSILFVI